MPVRMDCGGKLENAMKRSRWIAAGMAVAWMALAGTAGYAQTPTEAAHEAAPDAATAAQIPADQQATREQLAKLFEVMRMRQQFDSLLKMIPAMVEQQMHAQMKEMVAQMPGAREPTPEQQAALDKLMSKYMQKAANIYPAAEMIADASTVYQRHLTRSDVDEYIAFYSSPAGQHLLDAQPVIMREYMPMVMGRMQARSKELYADLAKDIHEAMSASVSQGPAGSSAPAETPASK